MCWNELKLAVVGTSNDNEDGTSRPAELRRLAPGGRINLHREPENPHDSRAVAVRSIYGITVGYLSRDHASWVGGKIDRGYDVRAIVNRTKGEGLEGATLGLVMVLNMEGDDPELDGDAALPWRAAA